MLNPEQVLARLADPALLHKCGHGHLDETERQVLADSWSHARGYVPGAQPRPNWTIGDIALLDELAAMIGPPPPAEETDPTLFLAEDNAVGEVVTLADRLSARPEADPNDEPISTYSHVLVDESQNVVSPP